MRETVSFSVCSLRAARTTLAENPSAAPALESHDDYHRSAPTPEHFVPLLYVAGLAAAANRGLEVLVDGYAYGSLSMAAYTLDATCPTEDDERSSAALPDPAIVPAADTNA